MTELEKLKKERAELVKRIKELELADSTREIGRTRVCFTNRSIGKIKYWKTEEDGSLNDVFLPVWKIQVKKNANERLAPMSDFITIGNLPTKQKAVAYIDEVIGDLTELKKKINEIKESNND